MAIITLNWTINPAEYVNDSHKEFVDIVSNHFGGWTNVIADFKNLRPLKALQQAHQALAASAGLDHWLWGVAPTRSLEYEFFRDEGFIPILTAADMTTFVMCYHEHTGGDMASIKETYEDLFKYEEESDLKDIDADLVPHGLMPTKVVGMTVDTLRPNVACRVVRGLSAIHIAQEETDLAIAAVPDSYLGLITLAEAGYVPMTKYELGHQLIGVK